MTKREQAWIVLLRALIELGGEGSKQDVLAYIQQQNYWYRNDGNSPSPASRPKEFQWRNEISYARQHMVEKGCVTNERHDWWGISNKGRQFFQVLAEKALGLPSPDGMRFTPVFWDSLHYFHPLDADEDTAERIVLERLSTDPDEPPEPVELIDAPLPKGPGVRRPGSRTCYQRNPAVARRALQRAGYRCEIDPGHRSFLCRNLAHPYMEPHHLIPMQMTDAFDVSLDREQNIFCLCSTCHNQIHYGAREDVRNMLARLFSAREAELCAILGRTISLDDLYRMYQVL